MLTPIGRYQLRYLLRQTLHCRCLGASQDHLDLLGVTRIEKTRTWSSSSAFRDRRIVHSPIDSYDVIPESISELVEVNHCLYASFVGPKQLLNNVILMGVVSTFPFLFFFFFHNFG